MTQHVLDNKYSFNKCDWKRAALLWDRYSSPFRLSLEDIKNYNKLIGRGDSKNILLLGATPELRTMFSFRKNTITLADFSSEMMESMSQVNKDINRKNETWLEIDWLKLDNYFKERNFSLIIGDLVLRNINYDKQKKFLKITSRLLTKRGKFITRLHFINKSLRTKDLGLIIRESFDERLKKDRDLEDLIASRLFDKNIDLVEKKVNKDNFKKKLRKYLKKEKVSKKEKAVLNNVLYKWTGKRTWTQRSEKEIEKLLLKDFIMKDRIISSDYVDSEFYPIYVLKKI